VGNVRLSHPLTRFAHLNVHWTFTPVGIVRLSHPLRGPAQIVVIDGLDRLESEAMRDQAAALLRDAALARRERTGDGTSPLTILASTQREDTALALMTEARRIGVSSLTLSSRYETTVPAPAEEHA